LGEGRGNTFATLSKEQRRFKGDCYRAINSGKGSGTPEEAIPEGQVVEGWTKTAKALGRRRSESRIREN